MNSTQSWGSQWWQFRHTPGHAGGVGIVCDQSWSLGRRHWWPVTTPGIPLCSQQRQCPALHRHGAKGYNLTSFSSCPPNDGDWPVRWSRFPLRIATSHSFTGFPLPQSASTQSTSVLSPGLILKPKSQHPSPSSPGGHGCQAGECGAGHHLCSVVSALAATNRLLCSPLRLRSPPSVPAHLPKGEGLL